MELEINYKPPPTFIVGFSIPFVLGSILYI